MQILDGGYILDDVALESQPHLPTSSTTWNKCTFLCLYFLTYKIGKQVFSVTFCNFTIIFHKCANDILITLLYILSLVYIWKVSLFSPNFL